MGMGLLKEQDCLEHWSSSVFPFSDSNVLEGASLPAAGDHLAMAHLDQNTVAGVVKNGALQGPAPQPTNLMASFFCLLQAVLLTELHFPAAALELAACALERQPLCPALAEKHAALSVAAQGECC